MNPVYTGKDVSYIDTKQAQRARRGRGSLDAERFATLAALHGARAIPHAALDRAWRQLRLRRPPRRDHRHRVRPGLPRPAGRLAGGAGPGRAPCSTPPRRHLVSQVDTAGAGAAGDRAQPDWPGRAPTWSAVECRAGDWSRASTTPARRCRPCVEHGRTLSFVARDVPATGWRTYRLAGRPRAAGLDRRCGRQRRSRTTPTGSPPTRPAAARVAPARDRRAGRELLAAGRVGNELLVYDEYPQHPHFGEGPWHLLPNGPARSPASAGRGRGPGRASAALGQRLVVAGELDGRPLHADADRCGTDCRRVDCTHPPRRLRPAPDRLLRLRWPDRRARRPAGQRGRRRGGRPRLRHRRRRLAPSTRGRWTTRRTPGSASARPRGSSRPAGRAAPRDRRRRGGRPRRRAIAGVARPGRRAGPGRASPRPRSLDAGSRATARCDVDSNLPDVRIAVGGPERNAFTAAVLAAAGPAYAAELDRQLAATGAARVWVPADRAAGRGVGAERRPARRRRAAGADPRRPRRRRLAPRSPSWSPTSPTPTVDVASRRRAASDGSRRRTVGAC